LEQQRQQQLDLDQDERQNNTMVTQTSVQSTVKQIGRKIDQDSPSDYMMKGDMPLQMARPQDDAQSQSIKEIVNEQL
jgi:hypothetical protein